MKNILEKENFRIDSNLSIKEKKKNWRIELKEKWYVNWKERIITVLKKLLWKDAYIWEYVSWVPKKFIGEQLFTYNALCRLWVEKRLPTFEDIKQLKDINLAGYWHPSIEEFGNIGVQSYVWLAGGNDAYFSQDGWDRNNLNRNYGFGGRLLKELDTSSIWQFSTKELRDELGKRLLG